MAAGGTVGRLGMGVGSCRPGVALGAAVGIGVANIAAFTWPANTGGSDADGLGVGVAVPAGSTGRSSAGLVAGEAAGGCAGAEAGGALQTSRAGLLAAAAGVSVASAVARALSVTAGKGSKGAAARATEAGMSLR